MIKLLYTNLNNITFSSSQGSNVNLGLTNLKDYTYTNIWKCANNISPLYLYMIFNESTECNTVIIHNHNLNSEFTGIIVLQSADDAGFTTGVTDVHTCTIVDDIIYTGTFVETTKKYWRLKIEGTIVDAVQIGQIYLGKTLDFERTQEFNYKQYDKEFVTNTKTSLNGRTITSNNFDGRYVMDFKFTKLNNEFISLFLIFIDSIRGKLYPFYFINDSTTILVNMDSDYNPVEVRSWQLNDIQTMKLKGKEVGDIINNVFLISGILSQKWII